jgi:hypothetical protein
VTFAESTLLASQEDCQAFVARNLRVPWTSYLEPFTFWWNEYFIAFAKIWVLLPRILHHFHFFRLIPLMHHLPRIGFYYPRENFTQFSFFPLITAYAFGNTYDFVGTHSDRKPRRNPEDLGLEPRRGFATHAGVMGHGVCARADRSA